jgi:hypothetical protein
MARQECSTPDRGTGVEDKTIDLRDGIWPHTISPRDAIESFSVTICWPMMAGRVGVIGEDAGSVGVGLIASVGRLVGTVSTRGVGLVAATAIGAGMNVGDTVSSRCLNRKPCYKRNDDGD